MVISHHLEGDRHSKVIADPVHDRFALIKDEAGALFLGKLLKGHLICPLGLSSISQAKAPEVMLDQATPEEPALAFI